MLAQLASQDVLGSVAFYFNGMTTADIDLYIDPAGSDVTGKGTLALPYATPDRAKADIPRRVEHMVHLHVAAGAYGAMCQWNEFTYGPNGYISVDASDAMADVSAELTVDAGGSVVVQTDNAFDLPIVGGGLGVDAYRGMFMEVLTGAEAGLIRPIIGNTATNIRFGTCFYNTIAAGSTVKVKKPGAEFLTPAALEFSGGNTYEAHLYFLGIRMEGTNAKFRDTSVSMVGCVFSVDVSTYARNAWLLTYLQVPATGVDNAVWAAQAASADLCGSVVRGLKSYSRIVLNDSYAESWVGVNLAFTMDGSSSSTYIAVRSDVGVGYETYGSSGIGADYTYSQGKSTHAAFLFGRASSADMYDLFAAGGKYGVELKPGATARLDACAGTAGSIVTAGALVGGGARIMSKGCTVVSTGAVQIAWGSGAAATAWPAANNKVDDALAALVIGVD